MKQQFTLTNWRPLQCRCYHNMGWARRYTLHCWYTPTPHHWPKRWTLTNRSPSRTSISLVHSRRLPCGQGSHRRNATSPALALGYSWARREGGPRSSHGNHAWGALCRLLSKCAFFRFESQACDRSTVEPLYMLMRMMMIVIDVILNCY